MIKLLIRIANATNQDRLENVGKSAEELSNMKQGIVEADGGWELTTAKNKTIVVSSSESSIFTLEVMFKKMQIHMLNDKQRVVSVTLQESHLKSHTTNDAYEINLMLGRIIVENKVEKTGYFGFIIAYSNLFICTYFLTQTKYIVHTCVMAAKKLATLRAKTTEAFLHHMQLYFINSGKKSKMTVTPLNEYIQELQRFHHVTAGQIDRAFVERLEISPLSLQLSFKRVYNLEKDLELSAFMGCHCRMCLVLKQILIL